MSTEADAAALRLAFNRAVESYPSSVARFLCASKAGAEQNAILMAWWAKLYDAVRDTNGGGVVLAELAAIKEENAKLRDALKRFAQGHLYAEEELRHLPNLYRQPLNPYDTDRSPTAGDCRRAAELIAEDRK